jgi:hypothetical protein
VADLSDNKLSLYLLCDECGQPATKFGAYEDDMPHGYCARHAGPGPDPDERWWDDPDRLAMAQEIRRHRAAARAGATCGRCNHRAGSHEAGVCKEDGCRCRPRWLI